MLSQGDFFLNATHLERLAPQRGPRPTTDDAEAIKAALACFCASTDTEVCRHHLKVKCLERDVVRLVDLAQKVWAAVIDPDARKARGLPGMGHEMYCKLFQLRPELQAATFAGFDLVMLDA